MTNAPLHELDPTGRFAARASDYARARPSYPDEAIGAVLAARPAGAGKDLPVADIGAGTGISARLVAERGAREGVLVIAVEPNGAMSAAAEPHAGVTWVTGAAEATGLGDGSVGLILCAQAFHWFEPARALPEFHRILAPGGRLAVLSNEKDNADRFTAGYGEAMEATATDLAAVNRLDPEGTLSRSALFTGLRRCEFRNSQEHDRAGLEARALSASYIPKSGPAHDDLLARLHRLHERYADARGIVTMRYVTRLLIADRADRAN